MMTNVSQIYIHESKIKLYTIAHVEISMFTMTYSSSSSYIGFLKLIMN